jgi:hypothetical protein
VLKRNWKGKLSYGIRRNRIPPAERGEKFNYPGDCGLCP